MNIWTLTANTDNGVTTTIHTSKADAVLGLSILVGMDWEKWKAGETMPEDPQDAAQALYDTVGYIDSYHIEEHGLPFHVIMDADGYSALATVVGLARLKYGNLDADVDGVLTRAEKLLAGTSVEPPTPAPSKEESHPLLEAMHEAAAGRFSPRFEMRRLMVLSTAHISEQTARWLDSHDSRIEWPVAGGTYGFNDGYFFYCAEENNGEGDRRIPDDLFAVMQYARLNGCDNLLLDNDAGRVEVLPQWEW